MRDYWAVLARRRWLIYLTLSFAVLVALVWSFLVEPQYRATAVVQIERSNPDVFTFRDLAQLDYSFAAYTDFYQTQYKIIAGNAVARRAVQRLGLDSHPAFQNRGSPGLLSRLRALLPRRGTAVPSDPLELAAQQLLARLEVSPVRNSHLVRVSWVGPDPLLAAEVANTVAAAYIQGNIETQFADTDQARDFLVNQIGMLKREIQTLEERLQQYGESKRIVSIDDSSNITLQALGDISGKRTAARTELAQTEAAYRAARATRPEALPEVQQSTLIGKLREEYAGYEAEFSAKSRQFKSDWPDMQNLASRLEQSRLRVELETERIAAQSLAAAAAAYDKARNEVENLDRMLGEQENEAQRLRRDAVEFANLQSEVQKKRETLNALIARQNEMALSTRLLDLDTASTNVRIIEPARPPAGPFRPATGYNLLVGLLLGLGLGVGGAFFLDYLDNTVTTPGQVESGLGLPVLAIIPHHGGNPRAGLARVRRRARAAHAEGIDLVTQQDGRAPAAEAYRELRTAILLSHAGRPPRVIAITSALPGEGKSATALNLGIVLAQLGRRVLVVDTDLRRPRLHTALGLSNARGVSTYLSGHEDDVAGLVVDGGIAGLHVLPSGPVPPNPSELLNSPRFVQLCRELEERYDHVVCDSPPVLSVSDPVIIAAVAEANILVARAGRTPRQSLRLAADRLQQAGRGCSGVVVNDLAVDAFGPYHYRDYGYASAAGEDLARSGSAGRGPRRASG